MVEIPENTISCREITIMKRILAFILLAALLLPVSGIAENGKYTIIDSHLHYLLERKLKSKSEHEEDDTQFAPLLDAFHAAH